MWVPPLDALLWHVVIFGLARFLLRVENTAVWMHSGHRTSPSVFQDVEMSLCYDITSSITGMTSESLRPTGKAWRSRDKSCGREDDEILFPLRDTLLKFDKRGVQSYGSRNCDAWQTLENKSDTIFRNVGSHSSIEAGRIADDQNPWLNGCKIL
jgi:hypothetical protein